ncbi:hypothetical protein Tco_0123241 [Tanacetum coccineum]
MKGKKVINWNDPDVLRYHAVQNRPFSVAEVRKNMCTHLKNQRGYKMSDFKGMSYEEIRPIFKKRSGFDLQQEPKKAEGSLKRKTSKDRMDITKKQKTDKQAEVD